jgi:glutamate formiminotransferase/formiminotetrahydrofolate cyclodeaminase
MSLSASTLPDFLEELASASPAPGGGSVAALCGALASALAAMTARLTLGRERYRESWEEMESLIPRADALRASLLSRIDEDAAAFDRYMAARRLPKGTDEEVRDRDAALRRAARETVEVPLSVVEDCRTLLALAAAAVGRGNPNAVTDAGCAALLAQAAARAAAFNVWINLGGIDEKDFVEQTRLRVRAVLAAIDAEAGTLRSAVEARIGA